MINTRRALIFLCFASSVVMIAILVQTRFTTDGLAAKEDRLRTLVAEFPILSMLVGFVVYALISLVPGTGGKSMVFGWLFGILPALFIVNFGLTCAALISFLVVRYVFQQAAHRRLGAMIRRIDDSLSREGSLYLVTLRLLHVPYTLTNYAAGATTVRASTFWWTTQLGMLPGNVVFVLAGSHVPSLRQLLREGPWSLINFPLLISLSLATIAPIYIRSKTRFWRERVQAE